MQRLPPKDFERFPGGGRKAARAGLEAFTVGFIAQQRVANLGEMHSDLVRAAGLQLAFEKGSDRLAILALEDFPHLVMGDRPAAARAHAHFYARARIAADRLVDRALQRRGDAPHQREITALQAAGLSVVGELSGERTVGAVVLRDDEEPACLLVETMHDAGTLFA